MSTPLRDLISQYPKLSGIDDMDILMKSLSKEMNMSLAQIVAELPEEEQDIILEGVDSDHLVWDSDFWLRPAQMPPDDKEWNTFAIVAGRGFGKLILVDTPIPTPKGWTKMGDIVAGDEVFDENGKICRVLIAHDPEVPTRAYELVFSDGTKITAGEEHQWVTWTASDRKAYNRRNDYTQVDECVGFPEDWVNWKKKSARWGHETGAGPTMKNTQEIVDTFTHGKKGDTNHAIPTTRSLDLPEKDLPITPYILGYWAGDGTKSSGSFTVGLEDYDSFCVAAKMEGYKILSTRFQENEFNGCSYIVTIEGLTTQLRKLSVQNNKHIPDEYLRGSITQRENLLAGMLDSDGSISLLAGHIEFSNTNKGLAESVQELARSLGQKPVLSEGRAMLYGKDCGPKYRVTWRPTKNFFRLERKAERFQNLGRQSLRNFHRMIISYQEVEPSLMRCLTVGSKNSMYLAGEGMIPTHNTRAGSEWIHKYAMEHPKSSIALVGRTAADVRDVMIEGTSGILSVASPETKPEYFSSKRRLVWPNGSYALSFTSEEPDQLRGPQFRLDIVTPILTTTGWKTMGTLTTTDWVYDERGVPCRVTAVHPIEKSSESYRVSFSDHTELISDAQHLWLTLDQSRRYSLDYKLGHQVLPEDWATREYPYRVDALTSGTKKPNGKLQPISTQEIKDSLLCEDQLNHCIPVTQPLQYDPLDFFTGDKAIDSWGKFSDVRWINAVEEVPTTLMRCITVDSPSHLYLAGEALIPTHNTASWADETAAWKHTVDSSGLSSWNNLTIATRLGDNPQIMVTTTPKRTPFMFELLEREKKEEGVVISRGSTMDNAGNLSAIYIERMNALYGGTRLAEQELYGIMLEEVEGALWSDDLINRSRIMTPLGEDRPNPPLKIIAVDPSMAENPKDECGIIVAGATNQRRLTDRHAYILEDASMMGSPAEWAKQVVLVWERYKCPVIVEVNQGGALVKDSIHAINADIPILEVRAHQGKQLRAEPVTLKYDQNKVHHIDYLAELESQMVSWIPGETKKSPDRVDALVYAVTALLVKPPGKLGQRKMRAKSLADRRLPETKNWRTR